MRIAEKRSPEETKDIAGKIIDGTLQYEQMIRRMFQPLEEGQEEDRKEGDEESFDLVELFLEESLRPELEKVADKYRDQIEASSWEEGYCPICGKEPKIGQIKDDENRRCLFCNQCGFEWSFMRIRCPFCGNEDQQELAYFTVEDDERYRVDVCNACKRYIKIVDFRESKETPNLDVEDIATLHLDMLANDEGYE
jgi:FdhE protein